MPRRLDAIDIEVPEDLAALIREAGQGIPATVSRSFLAAILNDGAPIAATVITLSQGPLTVVQLRDLMHRWLVRRRSRNESVGRVVFRGRRGSVDFIIDEKSDLSTIAELAHSALFPRTPRSTAGSSGDL